jgi:hypothetical protein
MESVKTMDSKDESTEKIVLLLDNLVHNGHKKRPIELLWIKLLWVRPPSATPKKAPRNGSFLFSHVVVPERGSWACPHQPPLRPREIEGFFLCHVVVPGRG